MNPQINDIMALLAITAVNSLFKSFFPLIATFLDADKGHQVFLISYNVDELDPEILSNKFLRYYDVGKRQDPKNNILIQIAPRLLETSDYSRQLTMRSVFKTLNWYSAKQRLFGLGLGNVYQYQQWLTDNKFNTDKFYNNFFVFHGNAILVHPHNVYFYFLLETGIVSVILFILPFVKYIYYSIKSKNLWMFILIAIILFINFFDSIMIVESGVAAMLYVIISLLYYKNSQQDYY